MFSIVVGKEPHRLLESQLTVYNVQTLSEMTAPTLRNSITGACVAPVEGKFHLPSAEGFWVVEGQPFAVSQDKAAAKQQHNAWAAAKTRLLKKIQDEQKESVGSTAHQEGPSPPTAAAARSDPPADVAKPTGACEPRAAPPAAPSGEGDECSCPKCGQSVPRQNLAIHQLRCRPQPSSPPPPPAAAKTEPDPPAAQVASAPPKRALVSEAERQQALVDQEALRVAAQAEAKRQQSLVEKEQQRIQEAMVAEQQRKAQQAEEEKRLAALDSSNREVDRQQRLMQEEQQRMRAQKAAEQRKILQAAEEKQKAEEMRITQLNVQAAAEREEIRRQHEKKEAAERAEKAKAEERQKLQQQIDELKRLRQAEVERIEAQRHRKSPATKMPSQASGPPLARPSKIAPSGGFDRALGRPVPKVSAPAAVAQQPRAGQVQPRQVQRMAGPSRGADADLMSDELIARMLQKEYEAEAVANDELVAQALQQRPTSAGTDADARRRQIEADERLARHLAQQLDDF